MLQRMDRVRWIVLVVLSVTWLGLPSGCSSADGGSMVTTRADAGRPLTYTEMDTNFSTIAEITGQDTTYSLTGTFADIISKGSNVDARAFYVDYGGAETTWNAAIEAAADYAAANGKFWVDLPPGRLVLAAGITLAENVGIRGAWRYLEAVSPWESYGTFLDATGVTGDVLTIDGTYSTDLRRCVLKDFGIVGDASVVNGINLDSAPQTILDGVYVTGQSGNKLTGAALNLGANSYSVRVKDSIFTYAEYGIAAEGANCSNLRVTDSEMGASTYGYYQTTALTNTRLRGCSFQSNGNGIWIDGGRNTEIESPYFENTADGGYDIVINGATETPSGVTIISPNYSASDGDPKQLHVVKGFGVSVLGGRVSYVTVDNTAAVHGVTFLGNNWGVSPATGLDDAGNKCIILTTGGTTALYRDFKSGLNVTGLEIGGGTTIDKHISVTTAWDPGAISAAATESKTVTVTGAALGNTAVASFSKDITGFLISAAVTATDTVTVTLYNTTGAPINLASGTVRVDIWQH